MSRIAFVTDTTCNLPENLKEKYNITVVPVYVIFGEKAYKDSEEMPAEEFYRQLAEFRAAGKGMPTTSQPSPEDFRVVYERLISSGADGVLSIHVTARSSGTCGSAELARSMLSQPERIRVVDSGSTSMHMGFMLLDAVAAAADGGMEEALAAVENVKSHSAIFFTVTDLEHLTASGRTEGHEKATEAALSVKPVISVVEGVPKALTTERTSRAALLKVLDLARERTGGRLVTRMAVVHANIPARAAEWAPEAAAALGFQGDPYIVDFGPGLAVHFGPGMLGVALQWE
jgi:DegV family protein with EDD domain